MPPKPPVNWDRPVAGAGGGGGKPIPAGRALSNWICLRCTYSNNPKNKNCEMCNGNRPPPPTSMMVHVTVTRPGQKDEMLMFDTLKPASTFGFFKDILENKTKIPFNSIIITHNGDTLNGKDDAKLNDLIFIDSREIVNFKVREKIDPNKKPAAAPPLVQQHSEEIPAAPPGGAKVDTYDKALAAAIAASMGGTPAPTATATPAAAGSGGAADGKKDSKSDAKMKDAKDSKSTNNKMADDDWGGGGDGDAAMGGGGGGDDDWGTGTAAGHGDDWDDKSSATAAAASTAPPPAEEDDKTVEVRSTTVLSKADIDTRAIARADEVKDVLGLSIEQCITVLRHFRWNKQALLDAWMKDQATARVAAGVATQQQSAAAAAAAADAKLVKMDCYLCGSDDVPIAESTALSCGHRFCSGCWKNWCVAEFDKGPTCVHTKCMENKCKTRVPDSVQLKYLPKEKATKYRDYVLANFVDGSKMIKFCPTANCTFAAELVDASLMAGPIGAGVECRCGQGWCWKCARDDHQPASCDQCQQWGMKNSSESENALWILANTKICPKCKVHIEKNQGCNHMTCRNCKHEFCWLCKANWAGHSNCALYDFSTGVPKPGTKMSKEEQAAESAKNSLAKYIHYFNRFDNHQKSIKFAEKTRFEADQRMAKLQSMKGVGAQAVSFLLDAVNSIIRCRRVLQWTYVYAYYLPEPKGDRGPRVLFEAQQAKLEELTDRLHGQSEKPLDHLMNNRMRTDIISLTRSVEKYRKNLIAAVHSIILDKTDGGGGGGHK